MNLNLETKWNAARAIAVILAFAHWCYRLPIVDNMHFPTEAAKGGYVFGTFLPGILLILIVYLLRRKALKQTDES